MQPEDARVRREARTVEIALATLLGGVVAVVPSAALRLVGVLAGIDGPGWEATGRAVQAVAVVAGAAVATAWLLRARRRGL